MADYLTNLWQVLLDLSPSLLLGLTIAGLIHVYLPAGLIRRGLSRPDLASVTRASLLGVPMPLCSCGVIPTALGLYRDGASRGATTAFMVSTPQIGADSILVSASFLGWPFALFKVVAAWVTGLLAGVLVNRLDAPPASPDASPEPATGTGPAGTPAAPASHRAEGLPGALRYAVVDLLGAIDLWLIGGVLLAALITTLTPPDFFAGQPWATGLTGMLVVLAIALPLYVCTTASVPIAASLISAGMPAGSALVFLMAGPATNIATIGAVYRVLGGRILGIYLGTVAVMSILFGLTFDALLANPSIAGDAAHHHHGADPGTGAGIDWTGTTATLVLLGLLGWLGWRRLARRAVPPANAGAPPVAGETTLRVKGMSCGHCVASVRQALESVPMVESAEPDLATGLVRVRGGFTETAALVHAVQAAGFQVLDQPSIPTTPPG